MRPVVGRIEGLVIVHVEKGHPRAEFVGTAPKDVRVFDIDLTGESAKSAKERLEQEIERRSAPGALLFPRVHGVLSDGSVGTLGLRRTTERERGGEEGAIHWDVTGLSTVSADALGPAVTTDDLEAEVLARLVPNLPPSLSDRADSSALLRVLLHELGRLPSEGESRVDYEAQRVEAARRALAPPPTG